MAEPPTGDGVSYVKPSPGLCDYPGPHGPHQRSEDEACLGVPIDPTATPEEQGMSPGGGFYWPCCAETFDGLPIPCQHERP